MKNYSQYEEETVIKNYFGKFVGTLLDIGANDGVTFSNSRALLEKGWYGVLVEPSIKAFTELSENNSHLNTQLHNVAIGEYCGLADFYESGPLVTENDHSLVSTMKIEETARWLTVSKPEHKIVGYEKKQVPVIDFRQLISNSGCTTFDFITIDVEGMELEILRQMDLKKLNCKLICIEYNGKNYERFDQLIPFPLIYKNKTNLIYGVNPNR